MKNVLKHSNGSQILLSNVDDGTNRIFINDEEIASSSWVGSGTYTQTIDGVTISITKISDLSGNIMLQKVSDNTYQLVRKIENVQFSHIGQIIESTTLDSLEKVQAIYGADTTWIQHSGYVLRGATSNVIANSASKTGGSATVTPSGTVDEHTLATSEIPSHTHGMGHRHQVNNHTHNTSVNSTVVASSSIAGNFYGLAGSASSTTSGYATSGSAPYTGNAITTSGTTARTSTDSTGGGGGHSHGLTMNSHTNLPPYKNVYIWERTA